MIYKLYARHIQLMYVYFSLFILTVVSIIFAEEIKGVPKGGDGDDDSAVFTASTIPFDDTYTSIVSEVISDTLIQWIILHGAIV